MVGWELSISSPVDIYDDRRNPLSWFLHISYEVQAVSAKQNMQ